MTATTELPPLEALKGKQHVVWSSGDYNKIAAITVPVSETLVELAPPQPGARVLDVATGTGHAALAAARRFADVTAIDYVSTLVDIARRRTEAEGLAIDIREADAEQLPFDDESFDVVYSAIGVMFTADHQRAANELVRVCRPGGRIALASWTPSGFIGRLLGAVGQHVPPPPAAQPPTRWGNPEVVGELLGDGVAQTRHEIRTVTQRFDSAEHFADFFLTHYGPTHKAAAQLADDRRAEFRSNLVELARSADTTTDPGCTIEWEYLVTIATRR